MRKYFLYELKKNAYTIICITIIVLALYATPILTTDFGRYGGNSVSSYDTQLPDIAALAGALAVIVPVWLFRYRMKKRSTDLYYSLPISHTKILAAKFLLGLIAIFVPYFISYWVGALVFLARTSDKIVYGVYYVPLFFASIPAIFCIYSISTFVFTRANSVIDGIVFIAFWMLALMAVCEYLRQVTQTQGADYWVENNIVASFYAPFAPISELTSYFQDKIVGNTYYRNSIAKINMAVGFTVTGLLAVASTVGLFLMERFTKAENASQISESWFGYRVMIPLLTATVLGYCNLDISEMYVIFALVIIGSLLLTVLYKRTIKFNLKQVIIFIGAIILGIILAAINTAV